VPPDPDVERLRARVEELEAALAYEERIAMDHRRDAARDDPRQQRLVEGDCLRCKGQPAPNATQEPLPRRHGEVKALHVDGKAGAVPDLTGTPIDDYLDDDEGGDE
jgi:hypothetical protein